MVTLIANTWFGRLADLPAAHLLLWSGLIALTLVLIGLVVSKWGKSRPLHTCAVLSLLAHVLLACLATIVRIVASLDQVAEGPPIRVRIVEDRLELADEPKTPPQQAKAAEPDEHLVTQVPKVEVVDQEYADEETTAAYPEPTNVPPSVEPTPIPAEPVLSNQASPTRLVQETPSAGITDAKPSPQSAPLEQLQTEWASALPVNAPVAAAPQPYANRQRSDRLGFVERAGGSRETEVAVRSALAWLQTAQAGSGRWDCSQHGGGEERAVLGHHRSGAGSRADSGVTALATLAYLGAGYSHEFGEYRDVVRDALRYLADRQRSDGNLGADATTYAQMYCHSMATFALAEAMALTGDQRLEPTVRRAVGYSHRAQHPTGGGWRYRPGQSGDTSQLGWQLMALRSAQLAGVEIPSTTWTGADRFLRSVARGRHGGLASYRPDAPASRTMTAEALYCRQLLTAMVGGQVETAAASEAAAHLLDEAPGYGQFNLYYWYYATLALHQLQHANQEFAPAWRDWNLAMKNALLSAQQGDGRHAGSWAPSCVWGGYGGRVYSTALATLCLEVYYRYAPTEGDRRWIATRPSEETLR